jgi:lipopolysaccharide biosynthesis glycosyltransferase
VGDKNISGRTLIIARAHKPWKEDLHDRKTAAGYGNDEWTKILQRHASRDVLIDGPSSRDTSK